MTTQPDQNQPRPDPIDYDPMADRANPASWVQSEEQPVPAEIGARLEEHWQGVAGAPERR